MNGPTFALGSRNYVIDTAITLDPRDSEVATKELNRLLQQEWDEHGVAGSYLLSRYGDVLVVSFDRSQGDDEDLKKSYLTPGWCLNQLADELVPFLDAEERDYMHLGIEPRSVAGRVAARIIKTLRQGEAKIRGLPCQSGRLMRIEILVATVNNVQLENMDHQALEEHLRPALLSHSLKPFHYHYHHTDLDELVKGEK